MAISLRSMLNERRGRRACLEDLKFKFFKGPSFEIAGVNNNINTNSTLHCLGLSTSSTLYSHRDTEIRTICHVIDAMLSRAQYEGTLTVSLLAIGSLANS